MLNISVLVSGNGTNLQAIIDAIDTGNIKNAKIVLVISDNDTAFALERAEKHKIPYVIINKKNYESKENVGNEIIKSLKGKSTDLVVLAGYLSILDGKVINEFKDKIINIHPSLIPKYCGKGYYGDLVHKEVLANKEKFTGVTVHFVDAGIDTGKIICAKRVEISEDETLESLKEKIHKVEHKILIEAIKIFKES